MIENVPFSLGNTRSIVKLNVQENIDLYSMRQEPEAAEMYIRHELARKLADKMIEEDLICIQTSDDPATMEHRVRATVKFIQE